MNNILIRLDSRIFDCYWVGCLDFATVSGKSSWFSIEPTKSQTLFGRVVDSNKVGLVI